MPELAVIASSLVTILDLLDRLKQGFKTPADVEAYNAARNEVRKNLVALLTSEQPASPNA